MQLPNENLSLLTDKVEAKAQQLAADINETPSAMAIFGLFYR